MFFGLHVPLVAPAAHFLGPKITRLKENMLLREKLGLKSTEAAQQATWMKIKKNDLQLIKRFRCTPCLRVCFHSHREVRGAEDIRRAWQRVRDPEHLSKHHIIRLAVALTWFVHC